jgi:hypothetical protein
MSASEIKATCSRKQWKHAAEKMAVRFTDADRDTLTSEEEFPIRVLECCYTIATTQDAKFYANLMHGVRVWQRELSVRHVALSNLITALEQSARRNDHVLLSIVQCAFDKHGVLRAPSKFVRSVRSAATRLDRASMRQGARRLSEAAAATALRKIADGVDEMGLQRGRPKGSGSVQSELLREVYEHLLTRGYEAERLLDTSSNHLLECVLDASEYYGFSLTKRSVLAALRKFRHDEKTRLTA